MGEFKFNVLNNFIAVAAIYYCDCKESLGLSGCRDFHGDVIENI